MKPAHILFCIAWIWMPQNHAASCHAQAPNHQKLQKQLLQKYCFQCHSGEDGEGGINLDTLDPENVTSANAEALVSVRDVINAGDMPPSDQPQFAPAEREALLGSIAHYLEMATEAQSDEISPLRRLTRTQYTNTLQDLLGVEVDFGQVLPEDGKSKLGFDNAAENMQTSALHIDYYEKIARAALGKAIVTGPRPTPTRFRIQFGKDIDAENKEGAEVKGYQAIPISKNDFLVDVIDENGVPFDPADQGNRFGKNRIGIGMRGSATDRFQIVKDGIVLYSAVPHVENAPKSWQGPSPNLKLLVKERFPLEGKVRLCVTASRCNTWDLGKKREGFISLRNSMPAPKNASSTTLTAQDATHLQRMEIDEDGFLVPKNLAKRSFAHFSLDVKKRGLFQIDFVHPYADSQRMPSWELVVGKSRTQERLQLDQRLKDRREITTPMTLAFFEPGKHEIKLGGRFFVGCREIIVTRLPEDGDEARALNQEVNRNRDEFSNATPSLTAFAGARTDDGMDFLTFDSSQELKGPLGQKEKLTFIGQLEDLPLPFFDDQSRDPLANITIVGIWNSHLVKTTAQSGPPVLVESIELEAPYFSQWPPKSHTEIFGDSIARETEGIDRYTRGRIEKFVSKAFRRPVSESELNHYMTFWRAIKDDFTNYEDGVKEVLVAVLCSPHFLFHNDRPPASSITQSNSDGEYKRSPAKRRRLEQYRIASRLSYFLWNSPPDTKLIELADRGVLGDQLAEQIERMLDEQKVMRMIRPFSSQWLRTDRLANIQMNLRRYPDFNRFVRSDMAEETVHFIRHVLSNDLDVSNLIDSDFAMLNQNLAEFYGVPNVRGNHFRPVDLPRSNHRGGLLSQGAFLSGHSDGSQAHPIKRAVWLKEKILGETPPPPPPNVPDLDPETPGFEKLTLKQQLELHRNKPSCVSCHEKIDPYGVVFQNYDAAGRLHVKDKGKPIDARSVLPDGREINGVAEMKNYILQERRDQFLRSIVEHVFAYAVGRDLRFSDEKSITAIVDKVNAGNRTLRSVFHEVALSDSFLRPSE